ncbi:MAG: hypothetical protein QW343_04135 [Candidatus Norongarragalinales archaeon]
MAVVKIARERDKVLVEAAFLRQQADELNLQVRQLAELLAENQAAQASLEALEKTSSAKASASEPWLSPLGSGVYAKTNPSSESVVIEVGARAAREASPSEARLILCERAKALEKALGDAQRALQETLRRMNELNALASA